MKKFGILVFIAALVIGLVVTNLFSFGKMSGGLMSLNFPLKFGAVRGSGNIATDHRDVSGFHGVNVGGVSQVEIIAQKGFSVEVEADDNLLPMIRTEVKGGILRIYTEGRIRSSNQIRVRIAAPDIDDLDVSGAANVTVADIKNDGLSVDSSGASKVKISGETSKFTAQVSGATKIDAESLSTENATVDASGASKVTVNVSGSLQADASGASCITYAGTPTDVQKKTSGASSISQK